MRPNLLPVRPAATVVRAVVLTLAPALAITGCESPTGPPEPRYLRIRIVQAEYELADPSAQMLLTGIAISNDPARTGAPFRLLTLGRAPSGLELITLTLVDSLGGDDRVYRSARPGGLADVDLEAPICQVRPGLGRQVQTCMVEGRFAGQLVDDTGRRVTVEGDLRVDL